LLTLRLPRNWRKMVPESICPLPSRDSEQAKPAILLPE